MNFKLILTLTTLTTALMACAKSSNGTSASTASSVLTIAPMKSTVAPGGTTTVIVTGGTGVYTNFGAMQGTLTPQSANNSSFLYTAPTTATTSTDYLTISDSSGAVASTTIMLNGTSTAATTGGTGLPFTTTSCQGAYTLNIGGVSATLTVVQNAQNQISGDMIINNYHYPINGNCAAVVGQTSGSLSFVNLIMNQTYNSTLTYTAGRLNLNGSVTTSSGNIAFTGYSAGLTPAPIAETTYKVDGMYSAMIGTNAGQIRLVNDGSGKVAGYLLLQGYFYSMSGTAGPAVALQNLTNGSNYSGTATFTGASVSINGNFTTKAGAVYSWTATK